MYFGENRGIPDATKLADVAAAVGIRSTALYHYFESKLHCLYIVMADALKKFLPQRVRAGHTNTHDDSLTRFLAVLREIV